MGNAGARIWCAGALVMLGAAGCVSPLPPPIWRIGPGGAVPGLFFSATASPAEVALPAAAIVPYDPQTVEIAGWFERTSASYDATTSFNSVPIPMFGARDSGYEASMKRLIAENELDGLLNQTVDTKYFYLDLFFVNFSSMETRVGGNGYRIRAPAAPLPAPGGS